MKIIPNAKNDPRFVLDTTLTRYTRDTRYNLSRSSLAAITVPLFPMPRLLRFGTLLSGTRYSPRRATSRFDRKFWSFVFVGKSFLFKKRTRPIYRVIETGQRRRRHAKPEHAETALTDSLRTRLRFFFANLFSESVIERRIRKQLTNSQERERSLF